MENTTTRACDDVRTCWRAAKMSLPVSRHRAGDTPWREPAGKVKDSLPRRGLASTFLNDSGITDASKPNGMNIGQDHRKSTSNRESRL
jgi:hypothetical protein